MAATRDVSIWPSAKDVDTNFEIYMSEPEYRARLKPALKYVLVTDLSVNAALARRDRFEILDLLRTAQFLANAFTEN